MLFANLSKTQPRSQRRRSVVSTPFCSLYSNTREPQTPSGRWGTLDGVSQSGYAGRN